MEGAAAMSDWDELDRKYGGGTAPAKDSWDALDAKHASPSAASLQKVDKQDDRSTAQMVIDKAGALASGFNRAYLSRAGLPFNPVDVAANVQDLVKAAIGAPYIAATGKYPPNWLVPNDRASVPGSGEWIINQARKTKFGRLSLDAPNPEDQGGIVQALGSGAGGGVGGGSSRAQEAVNMGMGALSAGASKVVGDATGNESLAILAGMSPQAAARGGAAAVKYGIRGNEAGRREMEQRIQDLKNAGVTNPTLGLASGNQLIGGIENLLQSTPGAVSIMRNARDGAVSGLEANAGKAASLASTNRGALESGRSIQKGADTFKEAFKTKQGLLYDKLGNLIGGQYPTNVDNTIATLSRLNADIPGAPNLSGQFKNARIASIESALLRDVGATPDGNARVLTSPVLGRVDPVGVDLMGNPIYRGQQVGVSNQPGATTSRQGLTRPDLMGNLIPVSPSVQVSIPGQQVPIFAPQQMRPNVMGELSPVLPVVGQRSTVIQPAITGPFSGLGIAPQPSNTLPFDAVKQTRTLVGNEIADNSLLANVPRSKWNPLYGALTEDMKGAAASAGPYATGAFNRANNYSRAGIDRMERIAPIIDRPAPEQTFTALANTLKENVSTFQAVKKSLPDNARGDFAGTIIERLGKAKPGQQDETGTKWSPETFLTNWSGMKPSARAELLSGFPNAAEVNDLVNSVAKATAMMRDNSKMWANPSGTAANAAARGLLGTIGVGSVGAGLGWLNPAVPLAAGGAVLGANLAARGVTSPRIRDFAARQQVPADLLSPLNQSLTQQLVNLPAMRGLLNDQ